VAAY